jgi:2-oxoglutarate dehydrogenase complex dehydrogenase (E1) component-like enzyme
MPQSPDSSNLNAYLDGVNIDYITGLYARYLENPESKHTN